MPLLINGISIERVSIIDDDEQARVGYQYSIEDLKLKPVPEGSGPTDKLDQYVSHLRKHSDAVLCDYRLRRKDYSNVDGDQIVGACYQVRFPAILCTTFTDWDLTLMRKARRLIPVLLRSDELNPESIREGFERCSREFSGRFDASREPSRTLVRVAEAEPGASYFYVVIPGWDPAKKLRVVYDDLPRELGKSVKPGARFHARVNVGAERHEELYISDWEAR